MASSSLTPDGYARARRHLMRRDPILGAAIRRIGACGLADRQRKDHLTALIGAIDRVTDAELRGVGLSGQKVGYLRDLCARISDGRLNLDELEAADDDQVIERLTSVKGFGRWTAEMFLMF